MRLPIIKGMLPTQIPPTLHPARARVRGYFRPTSLGNPLNSGASPTLLPPLPFCSKLYGLFKLFTWDVDAPVSDEGVFISVLQELFPAEDT